MTVDAGAEPLLLLGATGQIGEFLVRRAMARPGMAIAVGRTPPVAALPSGWRWLPGDLSAAPAALAETLRGVHATAAIATVPIWLLPPHLPTLAGLGVRRLVCFSTTSLFGKQGSRSPYEQAQIQAVGHAEAALARHCAAAGIAWTILRPTLIYGAGRDRTVTSAARFIRRFGFYPLAGPGRGLRQPVHADDLAAAALAALANPAAAGRGYNLGGGETLGYREMIARIFATLDRPARFLPLPEAALALAVGMLGKVAGKPVLTGDVARRMNQDLVFDDGAAARDFGYAPRRFLSGGQGDLQSPSR